MQPAAGAPPGAGRAERRPQGWFRDPSGAHQDRWFSDGVATHLVRDGDVESFDDPPPFDYSQRLVPASPDGVDESSGEMAEPAGAAGEPAGGSGESAAGTGKPSGAAGKPPGRVQRPLDQVYESPGWKRSPLQAQYRPCLPAGYGFVLTLSMVLTGLTAGYLLLRIPGVMFARCSGACYAISNQWVALCLPIAEATLTLATFAILVRSTAQPGWRRTGVRYSWLACGIAYVLLAVVLLAHVGLRTKVAG